MSKIFIVAGNYKQTKEYAICKGIKYSRFVYVNEMYKMQGIRKGKLIFTGSWDRRPNFNIDEILLYAKYMQFNIVYD